MQEGKHKVRCSTRRSVTIGWRGYSDMFRDIFKEFQASLRIRRKVLPFSSAKNDL